MHNILSVEIDPSSRKLFQSSVCLMLTMLFGFAQIFGRSGVVRSEDSVSFKSDKSYFMSGDTTSHAGGTMVIQLFKDLADSDSPTEGEDDQPIHRAFRSPAGIHKSAADHIRWFQQNRTLNNRKIPSLFILFQSWKGLL